jgi:hypothetical protein
LEGAEGRLKVMGKIGGFKEYSRTDESNIAVAERSVIERKNKRTRFKMYGLWYSFLSQFLSVREFNS